MLKNRSLPAAAYKTGDISRSCRGIGVLELAGIIFIFLTLALCGFGIVDLIQRKDRLAIIVERNLNDQNIRSLRLENGLSRVDAGTLRASLQQIMEKVSQEMKDEFELAGDARMFRLELEAAEVSIDSETGAVEQVAVSPQLVVAEGALSLPSAVQHEYDLADEFERIAGPVGAKSPYAFPSGLYGTEQGAKFLPRVLLLGMRAFVSFEGSFTDTVTSSLGFQEFPISSEIRVVPLRGEVGGL